MEPTQLVGYGKEHGQHQDALTGELHEPGHQGKSQKWQRKYPSPQVHFRIAKERKTGQEGCTEREEPKERRSFACCFFFFGSQKMLAALAEMNFYLNGLNH